MKDEELLAEVEKLLKTTPPLSAFMKKENDEDNDEWLGRVASVLSEWNSTRCVFANMHWYIKALQQNHNIGTARRALRTLLFESQHDLRMKTVGPLSIAVGANKPFTYFDEIRKITEQAREDLLFVPLPGRRIRFAILAADRCRSDGPATYIEETPIPAPGG